MLEFFFFVRIKDINKKRKDLYQQINLFQWNLDYYYFYI